MNGSREKGTDDKLKIPYTVPFINLLKKGIVYENTGKFKDSIYKNVYARAAESIEQIIADSREKDSRWGHRQENRKNPEIENVISFIGRRGTGKTSSMLSFLEALKQNQAQDFDRRGSGTLFCGKADMEDVRFFTLDCIDAAALEETESVFTLVLANIQAKISANSKKADDSNSYLMRSLLQDLGKIYKDYTSLDANHSDAGEYSSYEYLKNSASSQRIRASFARMVPKCLQYFLESRQFPGREAYLVIAIDDLDMAHYNTNTSGGRVNSNSYKIMREISKYFSVPGVIVLAAYNHTNLQQQCRGFFAGSNLDYFQHINETEEILRSGEKLASDFLEKVFAPAYRVYMPSWKKWDYYGQNIKIDIGSGNEFDDIFKHYREAGRTVFQMKELLLILYAEKAGIYYDCEGKKRHFLEVDSLRALNSALHILIGGDVAKKLSDNQIPNESRENVFKRIMDDVYFRFISEHLYLEKEQRLIYNLLGQQPDRRSEHIVQLVAPKIEPLGRNYKLDIKNLLKDKGQCLDMARIHEIDQMLEKVRDNHGAVYSYAELLHCIYHMTRENLYSKEFVDCLLHSYSVCLTQLYKQFKAAKSAVSDKNYIPYYRNHGMWQDGSKVKPDFQNHDSSRILQKEPGTKVEFSITEEESRKFQEINDKYQMLKSIIGKTVLGFWTQYYFPAVKLTEKRNDQEEIIFAMGGFNGIRDTAFKEAFQIGDTDTGADIHRMLDESIFLMTMYPDLLQWKSLEVTISNSKNGKNYLIGIKYNGEPRFELTAFVKLTILYQEYLNKMEHLLIEAFQAERQKNEAAVSIVDKICEQIRSYFENLWNAYYNWDKRYGNMILPIYSMDLMYNLAKHLFVECKDEDIDIPYQQYSESFFDNYTTMLGKFVYHLDRIDGFYCLKGNDSFAEKFLNCPHIQLLRELYDDRKAKEDIKKYIEKLINAIYNYKVLSVSPDDKYPKRGDGQ